MSAYASGDKDGLVGGPAGIGGDGFPAKQGHKCCGCCCDVRRAVIIVNSVSICLVLLELMLVPAGINFVEKAAVDADDDATKNAGAALEDFPVWTIYVFGVIALACYSAGIWGAINYRSDLVMVAFCAWVVNFVIDLLAVNIVGCIVVGLFAYPHWFLRKEINEGIMTAETYPNEVHSCCCV